MQSCLSLLQTSLMASICLICSQFVWYFPVKNKSWVWRNPVEGVRNCFFPWGAIWSGKEASRAEERTWQPNGTRQSQRGARGSSGDTVSRKIEQEARPQAMGRAQRSYCLDTFSFCSVLTTHLEFSSLKKLCPNLYSNTTWLLRVSFVLASSGSLGQKFKKLSQWQSHWGSFGASAMLEICRWKSLAPLISTSLGQEYKLWILFIINNMSLYHDQSLQFWFLFSAAVDYWFWFQWLKTRWKNFWQN